MIIIKKCNIELFNIYIIISLISILYFSLIFTESSSETLNENNTQINIYELKLHNQTINKIIGNTFIVKLNDSIDDVFTQFKKSIFQDENLKSKITNITLLPNMGYVIIKVKDKDDLKIQQSLQNNTFIKFIHINNIFGQVHPIKDFLNYTLSPSTQQIPTGVNRVDAERRFGMPSLTNIDVAILDSGIDSTHPDLNIIRQVDFTGSGTNDNCGHGTHVAGIIGAKNNNFGVVGVSPGVNIWSIKVTDGTDICYATTDSIVGGLEYILANIDTIDVVNFSWNYACTSEGGEPINCSNDPLYDLIIDIEEKLNQIVSSNIPIVVSAGNDGINANTVIPSLYSSVITTSAISDTDGKCGGLGPLSSPWSQTGEQYLDDTLAGFSNYGTTIDIAAPGVDILSTFPNRQYDKMSGTSMAAPHVTGTLAILKALHPDYSSSILRNELSTIGSNQWTVCNSNGYGYFTGDFDPYNEPLLYVKNISPLPYPYPVQIIQLDPILYP